MDCTLFRVPLRGDKPPQKGCQIKASLWRTSTKKLRTTALVALRITRTLNAIHISTYSACVSLQMPHIAHTP